MDSDLRYEAAKTAHPDTEPVKADAAAVAPGTAPPSELEGLKKELADLDRKLKSAHGETYKQLSRARNDLSARVADSETAVRRSGVPLTEPEEKLVTDPDKNKWKYQAEYFIKALEPVKDAWLNRQEWKGTRFNGEPEEAWKYLVKNDPGGHNLPAEFPNEFIRIEVPNDGKFLVKNRPEAIDRLLKSAPSAFAEPTHTIPGTAKRSVPRAPKELEPDKLIAFHKAQIEETEQDLRRSRSEDREFLQDKLKAARENLAEAENTAAEAKQKKSDLGSTFYTGFADPQLFNRLFPDIGDRMADWLSDAPGHGDTQRAMMRETRGRMDRRVAMAVYQLQDASKRWVSKDRAESIAFWNAVENGATVNMSSENQALADLFKNAFDSMRLQLQQLKPEVLQNYIENYFPHIWERPSHVSGILKGLLTGKRPLAGKASFLKKRTIPTMQDGLDLGFEPKSWNPVDSFLLKYAEMAQFLMAHQTLDVMKKSGTAKYVRLGQKAPPDWVQLDDRIGTVYRHVTALDADKLDDVTQPLTFPGGKRKIPGAFSEDIEDATHGEIALVGHYYAPADAAKVFNNFVSKGIAGRSSVYDTLRWMNDNLNALQLGISAFHATTISVVGAASDCALGLQQLSEGKPVEAGKTLARWALLVPSIFNTVRNGSRLMSEYLNPGSYSKMAKEAAAVAISGGRIKQNVIEIKSLHRAINAFKNGAYAKGLTAVPGAVLHALVAPVMDYYVPRMKLGIFYGMAHDILDEADKGKLTPEKIRARLDEAWNSVDNRAGQMVYDNLFWNKAVRDVASVSTRSVGWNYGSYAEAFGAVKGAGKAAGSILSGKRPRLTPALAFALALPLTTGMIGGSFNYLHTGKAPETAKDYFYLRNTDGTYLNIPGYMKDVFSFAHDPVGTVENKMGPLWEATAELLHNKDFYGTEIRHTDDPAIKQLAEVAEWGAKQAIPFSFSSVGKLLENVGAQPTLESMLETAIKHPGDVLAGQLGFTQAPGFIQNSDALNAARDYEKENAPAGTRTKEAAARTHAMHVIENMYRAKKVDQQAIAEFKKAGTLREVDVVAARFYSRTDPMVRAVRPLHVDQAIEVYLKATPAEKKILRPVIEQKAREIDKFTNDQDTRNQLRKAYHDALNPRASFQTGKGVI
jgi:hypothetical protein